MGADSNLKRWWRGVNEGLASVSLQRIGLVFLGLGALAVITLAWMEMKTSAALKQRQALNDVLDGVRLGESPEGVHAVLRLHRGSGLVLRELSTNDWVIDMPPDWNSRPMRLYVDFATGRVVRLRIRFQDDTNVHPREARADKSVR